MTDAELRDAAWEELKQTTLGWDKVGKYPPERFARTHWAKAKGYLDMIGRNVCAPPASPLPPGDSEPQPPPSGSGLPDRLPFSSGAADYYVDPVSGNDTTGDGSAGAPWKTINKAITVVTTAGSIIHVEDGTYTLAGAGGSNAAIYISGRNISGGSTNPVTIKAVNEGGVVITHPSDDTGFFYGAYISESSGWRIQGIKFSKIFGHGGADHPGADAVFIYASQWIEVFRCQFTDIGGQVQMRGALNDPCTDIGWWNNHHYPSGTTGVNYDGSGADYEYAHGVSCTGDYFTTRGTHMIYPGQIEDADYVNRLGVERLVVANCIFAGKTPGGQIAPHPQCRESYIVNNTFFGNDKGFFTLGAEASGYAAGTGVLIGTDGYSNANVTGDCVIKNNLFHSMEGHALYATNTMSGNVADTNYAFNCGYNQSSNSTADYNNNAPDSDGYSSPAGNTADGVDPSLYNPVRGPGGNYTPSSSSPLKGAADPDYCPSTDFNGATRPGTPTIGAVEAA